MQPGSIAERLTVCNNLTVLTAKRKKKSQSPHGFNCEYSKRETVRQCGRHSVAPLPFVLIFVIEKMFFLILNYISCLPISTPITDAIISPLVQPEESPKQCRPFTLVLRLVSILILLL